MVRTKETQAQETRSVEGGTVTDELGNRWLPTDTEGKFVLLAHDDDNVGQFDARTMAAVRDPSEHVQFPPTSARSDVRAPQTDFAKLPVPAEQLRTQPTSE